MSIPVFILAAGASRRLGRPKQLLSFDGQPLIRRQCRMALQAGIGPVHAVLGHAGDACRAALADLPVVVLDNPQWPEGVASSLRVAAARASDDDAAALLLLHVDQYALTAADLACLAERWRAAPDRPHLARAGDHLGPPAMIPAADFEKLRALSGDQGARRLLRGIVEVPLEPAACDIDEPSQLPGCVS